MNVFCLVDDDIEDLNEQLIGLQQTRELEKEQAHATIQQIKTELQETKDQLTSDNMILGKAVIQLNLIIINVIKVFILLILEKFCLLLN